MITAPDRLLAILEKIKGMPLIVVGDLMLDRYIWGRVERISPEAPVPVVSVNRIEDRLGGAGNVACNLASIGASVKVFGFSGADEESASLRTLLTGRGIDANGIISVKDRPTTLKTRVIAHAQQVVRIDRELAGAFPEEVQADLVKKVDAAIDGSRALLISDYGKGAIGPLLMALINTSRESKRLGLKVRPVVLDPNPANYSIYSGIDVAKPNRREAEAASGIRITDRLSAYNAGKALLSKWNAGLMLISLGEGGLLIVSSAGTEGAFLETVAQEVHDVSGAGDTVTALFAAAMATGATPEESGELANIAAGIVVSEVGTVAIDPKRLRDGIVRLAGGSLGH